MVKASEERHGTKQLQYRKCNKPHCNTCRNGPGHGPYWYSYYRDKKTGKLRSRYISKATPDDVVKPRSLSHRSEEHTSELQSHSDLVCRLLLEKKKIPQPIATDAFSLESGARSSITSVGRYERCDATITVEKRVKQICLL